MPIQRHKRIQDQNTNNAIETIENWINEETGVISTGTTPITAGVERAISHGLNYVPTSFAQCVTESTTGSGVLYRGTTAWDATNIYVHATLDGIYHLRVRR